MRDAGIVGLGAMGGPIAGHLVAAGVPASVHDLDAGRVAELVARGARGAAGPAEVAAAADVVVVVVPSDDDVRAVCLGPDGLLAGARPGSVLPGPERASRWCTRRCCSRSGSGWRRRRRVRRCWAVPLRHPPPHLLTPGKPHSGPLPP